MEDVVKTMHLRMVNIPVIFGEIGDGKHHGFTNIVGRFIVENQQQNRKKMEVHPEKWSEHRSESIILACIPEIHDFGNLL